MTFETRNPLPAGRYSVNVFDTRRSAFVAWLDAMQGVVTVASKTSTAEGMVDAYVFEVLPQVGSPVRPVAWDAATFGLPVIETASAKADEPASSNSYLLPAAIGVVAGLFISDLLKRFDAAKSPPKPDEENE